MPKLLAYLQLLRLPTVFTAMADILLGFLLTHRSLEPHLHFAMLLLASSCLYLAGMVFNDVFDRQVDTEQRPGRPIPSGQVTVFSAVRLGILLLVAGIGAAKVVGMNSLIIAAILTVSVFLYDGVLKKTPLGPIAMGACRFLNVMLGASAAGVATDVWKLPQLHVAAALGIYIAGVTWFARQEAQQSSRKKLIAAALVINLGLSTLITFVMRADGQERMKAVFVLGVILLIINRRLAAAMVDPIPQKVQISIKTLLLSLVMIDATLILFATGNTAYALYTAALLIPATTLGRWIPMT